MQNPVPPAEVPKCQTSVGTVDLRRGASDKDADFFERKALTGLESLRTRLVTQVTHIDRLQKDVERSETLPDW